MADDLVFIRPIVFEGDRIGFDIRRVEYQIDERIGQRIGRGPTSLDDGDRTRNDAWSLVSLVSRSLVALISRSLVALLALVTWSLVALISDIALVTRTLVALTSDIALVSLISRSLISLVSLVSRTLVSLISDETLVSRTLVALISRSLISLVSLVSRTLVSLRALALVALVARTLISLTSDISLVTLRTVALVSLIPRSLISLVALVSWSLVPLPSYPALVALVPRSLISLVSRTLISLLPLARIGDHPFGCRYDLSLDLLAGYRQGDRGRTDEGQPSVVGRIGSGDDDGYITRSSPENVEEVADVVGRHIRREGEILRDSVSEMEEGAEVSERLHMVVAEHVDRLGVLQRDVGEVRRFDD